MFYRLSGLAIMAALFPAASASAQSAVSTNTPTTFPSGIWTNTDQEMVVRIAPCSSSPNRFCGTLLQDHRTGPAANPPGHMLVRDLASDRAGWKGRIVDGGTTLNFTMRPAANDRAQARYCFGIVCESETWMRIANPPAPNATLRR